MMNSKTRGLLAFVVFSTLLAGCGAQDKPLQVGAEGIEPTATVAPSTAPTATATIAPSASPSSTPASNEKQTYDAIIYLTDDQLLETVERKATLEYSSEQELVEAAVNALQQDAGTEAFSLWKDINVLSTKLDNQLVTLDISIPDKARLGAPGELLLLETLEKTLFQFEFVQAIDILVDGKAVETLMGHEDLEYPIKKQP